VYSDYKAALEQQAGRPLPLVVGNDGNYGGVAEARLARGKTKASVLMLMPGSGLGAAFVGADGLCLDGDTLAGMEAGHMAAAGASPRPGGQAFHLRLRSRLGLRGGLHDHFRPAAIAGGKNQKHSPPRTRDFHRADQGKGVVAPHPRAKGRCAGAGDF
jgi:hypothetical protein